MIEGLGLLGMRKEAYVKPKRFKDVIKTITDTLDKRKAAWNLANRPGSSSFIDRLEFAFRNGVENRKMREELMSTAGMWSSSAERELYHATMDKLRARIALQENPLNIYKWMEGIGANPKDTLATAVTVPTALYLGDKALDKALD